MLPSAVFLDRDGVLNRKAPRGDYIKSPTELEMLPGAVEAVRLLNTQDVPVLVVTNQRGIALRRMDVGDLDRVHARLCQELAAGGARLDGVYYCPHDRDSCECRKPGTGLFQQAKRDYAGIEFTASVVIGDSLTDITAALRIGARAILLSQEEHPRCEHATSLLEAVNLVLGDQRGPEAPARARANPSGVPTSITGTDSRNANTGKPRASAVGNTSSPKSLSVPGGRSATNSGLSA